MIVLAIITILASIAISGIAKIQGAWPEITGPCPRFALLSTAVSGFYADRGFRPPDLNAVDMARCVIHGDSLTEYEAPGTRLFAGNPVNSDYDLWSEGENGATDPSFVDSDDIIRTHDGGRVGMAKKYGTPEY